MENYNLQFLQGVNWEETLKDVTIIDEEKGMSERCLWVMVNEKTKKIEGFSPAIIHKEGVDCANVRVRSTNSGKNMIALAGPIRFNEESGLEQEIQNVFAEFNRGQGFNEGAL